MNQRINATNWRNESMHMHDWVNEWVANKWTRSELLLCWTTSSPLGCLFSKLFLLWAASYRGDFFTDPLLLWVLRPPCAATRACAKSKTLCLAAVNLQQKSGSIRDAFLPAATPISLVRKSFLTRFCTVWFFWARGSTDPIFAIATPEADAGFPTWECFDLWNHMSPDTLIS